MTHVKTAISVERGVFEAGEELARELGLSRSELYTRALKALLQQRKVRQIQDHINAGMAALTDEERAEMRRDAEALHASANAAMRRAIERGESTW